MKGSDYLISELNKIDGRGYKAYKGLEGEYDFGNFILSIDHVQGELEFCSQWRRVICIFSR